MAEEKKIDYEKSWDRYWGELKRENKLAPWDVPPSQGVALDLPHFALYFKNGLPVFDIGCGHGLQTTFLANEFKRVEGIDISDEAINLAKEKNPGLKFHKLDLLDPKHVAAFAKEQGEMNLYMRGVLQQVSAADKKSFVNSISILLGKKGFLFLNELHPDAKKFFGKLASEHGRLPEGLSRVLQTTVTTLSGISEEELKELFPENKFNIVLTGKSAIAVSGESNFEKVPSIFALIKNR